jgi:hypothetical protein
VDWLTGPEPFKAGDSSVSSSSPGTLAAAKLRERAEEMARTGEYEDYDAIVAAVYKQGYTGPMVSVLDKSTNRYDLNELCSLHRQLRQGPLS